MKRVSLVLGACLSIGCSKKDPAPEAPGPSPTEARPSEPSADGAPAAQDTEALVAADAAVAAVAAPDVAVEAPDVAVAADAQPKVATDTAAEAPLRDAGPATALVQGWLAAQNGGDFAAYEAFYAGRFTGIKRAGDRTTRFDRTKWLADRKRMFSRAMKVEAADLTVEPMRGGALVTFTQTWESGSFRDVGPKQLVLVSEREGLRIAREEMLASTIAGASTEAPSLAANQFMPVVAADGFVGVVLRASVDPAEVKHEEPVSIERGEVAWAPIGTGSGTYQLFGRTGLVCEVSPPERGLFAQARFHFGQVQIWDGTFEGPDSDMKRIDDASVAREVVDLAGAGVHEVLRVDATACAGALWAREKVEGAATIYAEVDAEPFTAKAREALRKTGFWKKVQKDFESDESLEGRKSRWDEWESTVSTSAFAGPDGTTWVALSVSAGTGCGTFGASAWGLWRVSRGEWTLLSDGDNPGEPILPSAAFDADGDGKPEFTDGRTLIQPVGAAWRSTQSVASPDFDCPC